MIDVDVLPEESVKGALVRQCPHLHATQRQCHVLCLHARLDNPERVCDLQSQ